MLEHLLKLYSSMFDEPRGLPPACPYDHWIHLLLGTTPVVICLYRYLQLQNDELKRQCAAMLTPGIIRPSTSSFSAPVLLVKKVDGSWCFCIDYHTLNDKTSKDKFPIPIIDELLNDLHGAKFFAKLDLHFGYHQVPMHPTNIEKIEFHTHHDHFEFHVMPFGLSNVLATFRVLMNDIVMPFHRMFVLIFFDDILIYSSLWSEHIQHAFLIFDALRAHDLHLKRYKCTSGAPSVSANSIAMDSDMVDVVSS